MLLEIFSFILIISPIWVTSFAIAMKEHHFIQMKKYSVGYIDAIDPGFFIYSIPEGNLVDCSLRLLTVEWRQIVDRLLQFQLNKRILMFL